MKNFTFLILFLHLFFFGFAQETNFSFVNFNYKDGLPEKYIYSVTQDKKGSIWLGTGTGLYHFNGIRFTKINSPRDNAQHQIGNILLNVYTDYNGIIWLTSLNAIQKFDPVKHRFTSVNYRDKSIQKILNSYPTCFERDNRKNLWVSTRKNFWFKFESTSSKLKTHYIPKHKRINHNSKTINKLICSPDLNFALSNNGLFEFNEHKKIQSYFYSNFKDCPIYDGFYDKKNNCLWLACGTSGIQQFDLSSKKFKSYSEFTGDNVITLVHPKSANEIWFGANTLGIFNWKKNLVFNFKIETTTDFTYRKQPLSRLFTDKENNLWLASFDGLSMLPWQNTQTKQLQLFNKWANYTVEPYGVIKKNSIYFFLNNTSNGIIYFDGKSKNWGLIQNPKLTGKYHEINGIISATQNKQGLCIAANKTELFTLDLDAKTLTPLLPSKKTRFIIGEIKRILFQTASTLFIQTKQNGFYRLNIKNQKIEHYSIQKIVEMTKKSSSKNISLKLVDSAKNLWFVRANGLYMLDTKKNAFKHVAYQPSSNTKTIIQESIDIVQESPTSFWISTHESGIFHYSLSKGKEQLTNYNQSNSNLPSDYCENLVIDKKGNLWIGSLNGLVKFNTKTREVSSILGQQNGLKENSAIIPINLHSDGEITLSYYGAISLLNSTNYKINTKRPEIIVTSVESLARKFNIQDQNSLVLKPEETSFTVNYFSPSYTNSNHIIYRYKLSHFDTIWKKTNANSINYSNIPSGKYTLILQAINNDGIKGKQEKIEIEILTPFWKQPFYYLLLTFLIIGISLILYKRKIQQIRKEEKLKNSFEAKIAQLEMKAMRAQMNPHFIFNSLNSIQKYLLQNDGLTASKYLSKFSKLIRLILESSNQQNIQLSDEIHLMELYIELESMRFNQQFDYFIKIDQQIQPETTIIPSMIIQPYIENAIWHGLLHKSSKGLLKLEFKLVGTNTVLVIIEDNGIGRKKATELNSKNLLKNKSYGMKITADRISMINDLHQSNTSIQIEDLYDVNGDASGTRILITIPFKTMQAHENSNY